MKFRLLVPIVAGLIVAVVCARLGLWQLSRLHDKRAANALLHSTLEAAPVEIGAIAPPLSAVLHRRVIARGRYDEAHQLLLTGLLHGDVPGVHVLTPLVLEGGGAVMVDRGWLSAPDAVTARPQDFNEPGPWQVIGVAESIAAGIAGTPWRPLDSGKVNVWATHRLALDSLRSRMPYDVAAWTLRQLPDDGLPAQPVREAPEPLEEGMNLSYAVQWFLFAAAALGGSAFVALRGSKRG